LLNNNSLKTINNLLEGNKKINWRMNQCEI